MEANYLSDVGLYIDDLNKLRLLDPESLQQASKLRDECGYFVDEINTFKSLVDGLIGEAVGLSDLVDAEKSRTLALRSQLQSMDKQRSTQQQQLQAMIGEKRSQLERLRVEFESLQKQNSEQQRFLHELSRE